MLFVRIVHVDGIARHNICCQHIPCPCPKQGTLFIPRMNDGGFQNWRFCKSRNYTGHVCLIVLVVFAGVSSSSFPRRRARKASASFSSTRKKWPGSTRSMRQISSVSLGNVHSSTSAAASQLTENQSSEWSSKSEISKGDFFNQAYLAQRNTYPRAPVCKRI